MPTVATPKSRSKTLEEKFEREVEIETPRALKRFGERMKALRSAFGLSPAEFATRARVGQSLISDLESGKVKNLEVRTLAKLATAIGRRLDISFK